MTRADVLCGTATANGGTIITVPASSQWQGTVTLSATVQVASGGAAVMANARVSIAGNNSTPPAGDYLRVDLQAPASLVGAVGTGDSETASTPMTIITTDQPVSLVLNTTNTVSQSASANGRIQ